jgi:hypothetical protein
MLSFATHFALLFTPLIGFSFFVHFLATVSSQGDCSSHNNSDDQSSDTSFTDMFSPIAFDLEAARAGHATHSSDSVSSPSGEGSTKQLENSSSA